MPLVRFRGLVGPAAAAVGVVFLSALHALAPVEASMRDLALRLVPERPARHVAVVAIDEASLLAEGPWPWPRARLADIVSRVADSGASCVGIDMLLHEERPGDAALAAACRRLPCVVATTLDEQGQWILPTRSLAPAVRPAHAAFELDDDGILRRLSVTKQDNSRSFPALSVQLAALVAGIPITPGRSVIPGFRTPPRSVPVVSARDVLRSEPLGRERLHGRVVLVGVTAVALGDRVMTPRSSRHATDRGVLVHAAALESLLTGDTFREMTPLATAILAAALVWLALRAGALHDGRWRAAGEIALVLVPAAIATGLVLARVFVPVVTLTGTVAVAVLAVEAKRGIRMMRHGRTVVATLERDLGSRESGGNLSDVGQRLETLAAAIVRRRVGDVESKRVLAHELKTPLSAMRNLSQLLTGFDLTPGERYRVATLLGDETEKLQEMITRLLEIEQLALRDRAEPAETLDLGQLVAERAAFLSRGVSRAIDVASGANVMIRGDTALMERVIDNLVGNAVKYSPPPRPVSVVVRREGTNAVFEVMDHGAGVAAAERQRIFASFTRGEAAAGTDGLGLGLALVAEAIRWHGGTIAVVDRDGGGSIFRVRLPAAPATDAKEAV